MKILVATDGSEHSTYAVKEFCRLFPERSKLQIKVVSAYEEQYVLAMEPFSISAEYYQQMADTIRDRAGHFAAAAAEIIRESDGDLDLTINTMNGLPEKEIVELAEEWGADLIVVGSQGRSAVSNFFLGSISQKVLTEADCSVRVARGRIEVDPAPVRIVIGFDGSKGAQAAVDAVASRHWRDHSEIRLVAATEEVTPSAVGRFIPPITHLVNEVNETEREWLEKLAANSLIKLQTENISASLLLHGGNPKNILVEETEKWNANCIFVGANAFGSRLERFLLGSTSAAVAARAHCSVEVVRRKA